MASTRSSRRALTQPVTTSRRTQNPKPLRVPLVAWANRLNKDDGDGRDTQLAAEPSPVSDAACKHREDLIDALLCAWTASLWARHGLDRCQVLGLPAKTTDEPMATITAPARPRPAPAPNHLIPLSGRRVCSKRMAPSKVMHTRQRSRD